MNSYTCPMLGELTKMIADEIKLDDRDVFVYIYVKNWFDRLLLLLLYYVVY